MDDDDGGEEEEEEETMMMLSGFGRSGCMPSARSRNTVRAGERR